MKYKKKWYEYKQPKRRLGAFCEQNNIQTITTNVDEVIDEITKNFYCTKSFLWKSWDEFLENK